jgi:hypothetical protein
MLADIAARIPTRTTWRIEALDRDERTSQRLAFIEAYEIRDGLVMVDSRDGPAAEARDVTILGHPIGEAFSELVEMIAAEMGQEDLPSRKGRGPTAETRRRAEVFKAIKDAHPNYSWARVAMEANRQAAVRVSPGQTPPKFQAHHVRYAYEAMGWGWKKSSSIRD